MSTLCMLLHLSALIALMRGLSMSSPRCPCPVFCMYLSVEACLSPSLPFAVFALRLVGCDNVCCSSLVLSITAGSGRFPALNSQSIYVPFGLVNSKKKEKKLVMSLPLELGGLALVDLEAHTQTLRAKVPAMLLHPKWLPWKGLMTASFGRAFRGLGLAACVQHFLPTRVTVGLPQRHAAYLQAFMQLGAHRSVGHLSMTKEQIALEPLQGNHSVAQKDGLAFFPSASLPQELRGHSLLG